MRRALAFSLYSTCRVAIMRARKSVIDKTPVHCQPILIITYSPLLGHKERVMGVERESFTPLILARLKMMLDTADCKGNKREPQKKKTSKGAENTRRRTKKKAVSRKYSLI